METPAHGDIEVDLLYMSFKRKSFNIKLLFALRQGK